MNTEYQSRFIFDITIAFIIKIIILIIIKFMCFNNPQAKHMSLPSEKVAKNFFSSSHK